MLFPQTQEKLFEMAASQPFITGAHGSVEPAIGKRGLVLGETIYDPLLNRAGDVKPNSFKGFITGLPHVRRVLPQRALMVDLVVDTNSGQDDYYKIADLKQKLGLKLANSIWDSSPSATDWFRLFYLGDEASSDMRRSGDQIKVEDVRALCLTGVTLVVSDFRNLDFDPKLSKAVGIKVDHPLSRKFPSNRGVIPLSGYGEVNTNKFKEVNTVNQRLEERHRMIVNKMTDSGLSVANVIFEPGTPAGFNTCTVDQSISGALNTYAKK